MPDLDEEYLREFPKREILLQLRGRLVSGSFEFGLVSGDFDGRVEPPNGGSSQVVCSFDGADEMHPAVGIVIAEVSEDRALRGEFRFHQGDSYRFSAKRATPATAKRTTGRCKTAKRELPK